MTTKKERFADVWARHSFTTDGLAREAGVGEAMVSRMLERVPIPQGIATHVLATLSSLVGQEHRYTLDTVEIAVTCENSLESEVTRMLAQIDTEAEAMMRGLHGLSSGSARHEEITHKWDAILGSHYDTLKRANQATP